MVSRPGVPREALDRIEDCRRNRYERQELDLHDCALEALPPELFELHQLTNLDLSSNQLTILPAELGRLSQLARLDLSNNQLTTVPPELGELRKLTVLHLSNNQLTTVPPELGKLTSLRELRLATNQLTTMPPELGKLSQLTELRLASNQLTTVPPELGSLTALRELRLSNNQLTTVPPELGSLSALRELRLAVNQLTTVPPELGKLSQLIHLDLSSNQLTAVPSALLSLSRLTALHLSRNRLATLPPDLGQLTLLTHLNLSHNQLTTLPQELGKLSQLTELNLSHNRLSSLPWGMTALGVLTELALHDNPELELPAELLEPTSRNLRASPRTILDYYFSRVAEGEEPMREVRLLLVGRGRVGKTSLLKSLRGERPDPQEPETPGITVQPLSLTCPQGAATAHVWDFGGQEFLHGTHQIFLAERCVYLLVLGGSEGTWESETDYWLRFIQSFGGESPVVVVMSRYDEHPFSVDRYRLQERCPQIAGFVETDAFTKRGMDTLRELLQKTVEAMHDVWLGVPTKWHRVKEQLAVTPQSFLEFGEYRTLCSSLGVTDEGKQESLALTLHRLGIALNFRDHHRLRDTSVLKPKWVTEAIYGLIRFVQQKDCHGVLELRWMDEALAGGQYPKEKHAFLLELMEKFEVAFPLEGTAKGKRWLIPELLREEQPEPFTEFRGEDARRVRFSYPQALPPGLLPRFIVRTHELSDAEPNLRWRSGVVVELDGCKALVRLDRVERRTEVAVISAAAGDSTVEPQRLFDLIRAHLIVLHDNVRVVEELELDGYPDSWVRTDKLRLLEAEGTRHTKEDTKERTLANVDVIQVLDGIESSEARAAPRDSAPPRLRLFVSYAHDDERALRPLSAHLTILGQRGYIQVWQDRQLITGEEWRERILEELDQADIVLLLYSTHSRASTFIQETEAPRAVKRARSKKAPCTLIVVPLDRKDWDPNVRIERDLKTFQTATWNAKPVLWFSPQRDGWREVEHAIRKAVEARRGQMRPDDVSRALGAKGYRARRHDERTE